MIEKIIIKNTATFDNEGVEIDNLKKNQFCLWSKWLW